MTNLNTGRHMRAGLKLGVALTVVLALPGMVSAATSDATSNRVLALETQAGALSEQLDGLSAQMTAFAPVPPAQIDNTPRVRVAQSSDLGALNVRVGQLEEQIRLLTGQVEGLQFQMTQLQTLLERMQEDNDARFNALEGNSLGKTDAVPQSGGEMPTGEVPPSTDLPAPGGQDSGLGTSLQPGDGSGTGGGRDLLDPNADTFVLGTPEQPLGTLSADDLATGLGQPLHLDGGSDSDAMITDADADAQYQAGYDAVVRGDYEFAEEQFRQFIGLFPDHPQAPDATNWLGEALIQKGQYDEAADILLTGFQSYPNSSRAPDMLMKLGIALRGAGEYETACRTFEEVQRRYPDVSPAFQTRLAEEAGLAQC